MSFALMIGGPPGAGKTTLARAVAAARGASATSGDDLAIAARTVTTPETHPPLHLAPDHLSYFTDGPPERLIADATRLEDLMWPVIERVTRRHLADGSPFVLDWWLLPPRRVVELDGVRSAWLHVEPHVLDARERALVGFRDGSGDPDRMHANFMARSLWRNELVAREAGSLGLPVLHQDGTRTVADLMAELEVVLGPPSGCLRGVTCSAPLPRDGARAT